MKKGIGTRPNGKNGARAKITSEEKTLLRAALRQYGTERAAARGLGLKVPSQFGRMLRGEMRATPELKAAVQRARVRARRAFCFLKRDDTVCATDVEQIREVVSGAYHALAVAVNRIGAK